eukprot:jgi/Hompol1/2045/HPOL_005831-RA
MLHFTHRPGEAKGLKGSDVENSPASSLLDLRADDPIPEATARTGPFVIAVTGGGAAGKKEVVQAIMRSLERSSSRSHVALLRLEDFYLPLSAEQLQRDAAGDFNFDHPDAIDFKLLAAVLRDIVDGKPVSLPSYDFHLKKRCRLIQVFVDVDSDVRLARQVVRDTEERYRMPLEQVLQRYVKFVKPCFEEFILPTKKYADVIIPRGESNIVAVELLTNHIIDILRDRDAAASRDATAASTESVQSGAVQDMIRTVAAEVGSAALIDVATPPQFVSIPQ